MSEGRGKAVRRSVEEYCNQSSTPQSLLPVQDGLQKKKKKKELKNKPWENCVRLLIGPLFAEERKRKTK